MLFIFFAVPEIKCRVSPTLGKHSNQLSYISSPRILDCFKCSKDKETEQYEKYSPRQWPRTEIKPIHIKALKKRIARKGNHRCKDPVVGGAASVSLSSDFCPLPVPDIFLLVFRQPSVSLVLLLQGKITLW